MAEGAPRGEATPRPRLLDLFCGAGGAARGYPQPTSRSLSRSSGRGIPGGLKTKGRHERHLQHRSSCLRQDRPWFRASLSWPLVLAHSDRTGAAASLRGACRIAAGLRDRVRPSNSWGGGFSRMSATEPYEGFYEDLDRWDRGERPAQPEHPIYGVMAGVCDGSPYCTAATHIEGCFAGAAAASRTEEQPATPQNHPDT
jgi:hypothetical protein